ncbi:hypothetical protein GCM10010170_042200 [Dactylosporangium salmoneum]|uniref:Uncharacterized protein n=1 Tax=Dactylosporangium salmoneum TaxID=53361 RepID=A0ABN3GHI2_9ACTN
MGSAAAGTSGYPGRINIDSHADTPTATGSPGATPPHTCWTRSSSRADAGYLAVRFQMSRSASGGIQGLGSVAQLAS